MWKSATARASSGSRSTSNGAIRAGNARAQRDADGAVEQIADRQPPGRGIVAGGAFQHRVDRGAEIGAEHQGERGLAAARTPLAANDITSSTTATLECAAQVSAGGQHARPAPAGSATAPSSRRRLGASSYGVTSVEKLVQRHQHQAEADQHAAEIARARAVAAAEQQHADQDQRRRQRRRYRRTAPGRSAWCRHWRRA